MQPSHKETLERYDVFRAQARDIAKESLPSNLKGVLNIEGIDHKALNAFQAWKDAGERKVSWDWAFSRSYKVFYPKSFDMSVWLGNTLCSMSLGRPTFRGTEMRLDFIERAPKNCPYAGEMFNISLLAYEIYGDLIGAKKIRIMEPMNEKLIKYYMSHGGFKLVGPKKGNPHYLVRDL